MLEFSKNASNEVKHAAWFTRMNIDIRTNLKTDYKFLAYISLYNVNMRVPILNIAI